LVGHDTLSETAEVLVGDEGLAILSLLKVQSVPLGNLGGMCIYNEKQRYSYTMFSRCIYAVTFDGDEMNMHMAQNVLAETELRHLAATPYQMISPSANAPIIGIYQDSLLGSYRITRPNIKFTPREAMNLLMMFPRVDVNAIREAGDSISNFDVLTQILSPITLKYKTKLFEDGEEDASISNNVLEIRNGKYIRGQIEKSVLASTTKGIIHRICNDYGHMQAADFIDDLQNVVTEYMKSSSFSVGISDLIANKTTQDSIIQVITAQKQEVQSLINRVHLGIFENNTAMSNMMKFESDVNNTLNDATNQAGKIGRKSLSKTNRFVMIVNSGSKGTPINISQMISCLGQTNVDGKRIPYGFENRTLPHFNKFDDSPGARGFIENSYISGLSAPELFFHAMGGRIGLIDTACKSVTWETPIIIIENDKPKYIEIGRWIDTMIDSASPENVKHFTDRQMELMDIEEVYIPTTDEHGNVTWGEITAVTRHDPGTALYEIKTHGGRSVIVTESKSLLIWNPETKTLDETSTPDIKIGHCVPVTGDLCKPPVILEYIDVADYLPKTEFVYGTDFNIALSMMHGAMENRSKIPAEWWSQHNGKSFVLPYSKKSSLQRTSVRSNIENIKDGYVYPYNAVRKEAFVPDRFALNEENGVFLGLFLAEGHSNNSHVTITNNNENVRSFVKSWFDNHSISYTESSKTNKVGGLTTTITGNSSVLSKFLLKLVGHKAGNKFVPSEAFLAPDSFILGILNGYYSGDGTITKNSIDVGSASKRLIEGISMLCSRFGIFGRIAKYQLKRNNVNTQNILPTYRFSISARWAKMFSEKVSFIEEAKNQKLKTTKWRDAKHQNFQTLNNVVLDPITEINILGVENYPKVYDLTIPSTLNFGLANGLQVRDTSQTGYIQRRLIKGLEDLKVEYDMTVRNNKGKIIQFAYGDDGFDSTRVENQIIPLVGMTTEDIYLHYDMVGVNDQHDELLNIYTKGTIPRIRKQVTDAKKRCQMYIDKMIAARKNLVESVFRNKDENSVKLPVAIQNAISNIQGQLSLNSNSIVDITPLEAFELIEEYYKKLNNLKYVQPKSLFEVLYYFYLSPKDLLVNKRFHRRALVLLLEMIVLKYKQAIVHPGEMVGVIAGQSLGEPTTQLTLNSVTYETEILVRNSKNEIKKVQIGDFTKWGIETSKKIDYMQDKDTTYAELSEYYEVPSATEDGHTVWRRIEAVTKHPVINEDGTDTMLKITTVGNREVIATKAKSFLQLIDGKIIGVNGKDLKVGDYLPVSKKTIQYAKYLECGGDVIDDKFKYETEYVSYTKIPNIVNGTLEFQDRNDMVPDIEFDQIISIEEISNTTNYAYDLTVEDTRNFDCLNGLCMEDTFHLAGVASKSNVTRGVPRIEEILRLTKNPKNSSMTIQLKPMDELSQEKATQYATMLEHTKLVDVIKSVQICFDPSDKRTTIVDDQQLMEQFYEFEDMVDSCLESPGDDSAPKSRWVIRLEISPETLLDSNITMDDIHFAITNTYENDISCVYSDYNSNNLVFRIRLNSSIFNKKKGRGNAETLDQSDEIYMLRNFQENLLNNIVLRGVQGVRNVMPRKLQNSVVRDEGKYTRKDTWVLDTTGTNLMEVLGLDYIDSNRTFSNDIKEIFDVLGIEAARQVIYNEFVEVMEFSDVYINYHHLSLLCDRMTSTKGMVSIFRSGILNDDIGPISKSTFEVHTEVLLTASRHADFDHMRGVSANVMMGQMGVFGTGSFQLVLDMDKIRNMEDTEVDTRDKKKEIERLFGNLEDKTDLCAKNRVEIRNNLAAIKPETMGECDDGYDAGF
jgi:DNA-directed RNA polymerase beta' subunit